MRLPTLQDLENAERYIQNSSLLPYLHNRPNQPQPKDFNRIFCVPIRTVLRYSKPNFAIVLRKRSIATKNIIIKID